MALTDLQEPPQGQPRSVLRTILPFTSVAIVIAALYVAWTFYSRSEENKRAEQAIAAKKDEANKRTVDQVFGSGEVKIFRLSADPIEVAPGEMSRVCYGVTNAKTVKIDPPVEDLKPSITHCMEVHPKKSTVYKLTATDGANHSDTRELTVRVR